MVSFILHRILNVKGGIVEQLAHFVLRFTHSYFLSSLFVSNYLNYYNFAAKISLISQII